MKCPYCKEEIERNTKICPICSEKIPVIFKLLDIINQYKKQILVVIISIFVLYAVIAFGISTYKKISVHINNPTYKSVIEHESISYDKNPISALTAIEILNNQSNDLMELLQSKESKRKKNNVFTTFYNNLKYYNNVITEKTCEQASIWNPKFEHGKKDLISGLLIEPITTKNGDGYEVDKLKILSPSTDYIGFVYAGEGYFETAINYKYLKEKYAEYLGNDWKEYIEIRTMEQKDLNGITFYDDGAVSVEPSKLVDWVVAWQNFQKKHPKFCMNNEIGKNIRLYTSSIMWSSYVTFDYTDDGEKFSKIAKDAYEKFLEKVDKKSPEYEAIQNAYELIKKHDYKFSDEFVEFSSKYSDSI